MTAKTLFHALLLPPGFCLLLIAWGLALQRHRRSRLALLCSGVLSLYLASLPATAEFLRQHLESDPPVDLRELDAQAIVVLGGGRRPDAPEYGGDTLLCYSLERVRYAALLQRRTGLPIVVSGGRVHGEPQAEAELMRAVLAQEFGAIVEWVEDLSRNTLENAIYTDRLLAPSGIRRVVLVTHAWHMSRAAEVFRAAGFTVLPAPTGYYRPQVWERGIWAWLPNAAALHQTELALHEFVGRGWYRLH